jgi:anti-anti-sigma regulatory factor
MLRLITVPHGSACRLELHGTLGGEWVPLLRHHWQRIARDHPSARVTLALSNVDFVDAEGERLLQQMADAGVQFVVSGCMNRYVVERLQAGTAPTTTRR